MIEDISKKIDVLVDMTASSSNIDALKLELNELEKDIAKIRREINLLTDHTTDKYFKASDKQVDENIKLSLELKIRRLEKTIKEIQDEINDYTKKEIEIHKQIEDLKNEIEETESYIQVLNSRCESLNGDNSKDGYLHLIEKEQEKLAKLNENLEELTNTHKEIIDKLNDLNISKEEMNSSILTDKDNLSDTKARLSNSSSYIDLELKELDEERIESLKDKLRGLEKRRLEIITDPVIVADEAKILMEEDDRTGALNKIKELSNIVKSKPFMDIEGNVDLENILSEKLEALISERDQFALLIDEKDYNGKANTILEERINFLEGEKATCEKEILEIKEKIKVLDSMNLKNISNIIEIATNSLHDIHESILEYQELINNNIEEKTPKRKAVLANAYKQKCEDEELLKELVSGYKNDQKALISKIFDLENTDIANLNARIEFLNNAIARLKSTLYSTNKTKDVLELENDKKKLKNLDDNVKALKFRMKFKQTPDEIFDEIEVYFGSIRDNQEELEDLHDKYESESTIDVSSLVSVDDIEEELPSLEEIESEPLPTMENVTIENPNRDTEPSEIYGEKHKVIKIEDIPAEEEKEEDNPFIIGDYKDDEYVDITSIFNDNGVL